MTIIEAVKELLIHPDGTHGIRTESFAPGFCLVLHYDGFAGALCGPCPDRADTFDPDVLPSDILDSTWQLVRVVQP